MTLPPGLFKSRRSRVVTGLVVFLVVVGGVGAWFAFQPSGTAQAADTTLTVGKQTLTSTVSVSGTVAAASAADLDFASSGTVTKVLVAVGDEVTDGQALARIDATSLNAALTAAKSSLTAAETQYDELVDDDADDVQVAAAESAVVSAEDSVQEAQEAVDNAVLRSTIDGTVTVMDLTVGDVVGTASSSASTSTSGSTAGGMGAASTAASTSAVRVVASGAFVVDTTVSAADVDQVAKGQQATLTVTGVDENVFGTVSTVGKVAETGSGGAAVFPVTIKVTGTRDDLYPGTSATAEITVETREDVLAVTTRALSTTDGATTVIVRKNGKDSTVEVTTGDTFGQNTEITEGLSEGDVIVLQGFAGPGGGRRGSGTGNDAQMPDMGSMTPPDGMSFPGGGGAPMGGNQ